MPAGTLSEESSILTNSGEMVEWLSPQHSPASVSHSGGPMFNTDLT